MHNTLPTDRLLAQIRQRFYAPDSSKKRFHQDRRMLLYTLTWPAGWMERRGLPITSQAYEKLLTKRLDDIAKHGDPQRYRQYFPRYLLKCIQDWFHHHGDELYEELKHVRNQLCDIENLLRHNIETDHENAVIARMAEAHAVLKSQCHRRTALSDNRQLNLFSS